MNVFFFVFIGLSKHACVCVCVYCPSILASLSATLMSKTCSSVWLNPKSVLLHWLSWMQPTGAAVSENDQHYILGRKPQTSKFRQVSGSSLVYFKLGLTPRAFLLFHKVNNLVFAIGIVSSLAVIFIHLMSVWAACYPWRLERTDVNVLVNPHGVCESNYTCLSI